MKKFIKKMLNKPMLFVFLVVLILYAPIALLMPADTSLRAIVTRIGIDSSPEGVEVSAVVFVPTPNTNYTENYKLFSAEAENVALAFQKISRYAGKKISLNLAEMIVVNEEISSGNLAKVIDSLTRSTDILNNAALICTNQSAKDFLNATLNLNSASDLNVEELIHYSQDKVYNTESNIESFYQGYFSPQKISMLGYIELASGTSGITTSGGSSASGSSGGGESSGGSSSSGASESEGQATSSGQGESSGGGEPQKKNTLLNEGRIAVYKDGTLNVVLTPEQLKGLNWLNPRCNESYLTVYNVTDEVFTNATITFKLLRKKLNINVYFVNDIPVFEGNLSLIMEVDQVKQENLDSDIMQPELSIISPELRNKVNMQAKKEFKVAQDLMIENKLDLVHVYDYFKAFHPKKFERFLNSLYDQSNFLEGVIFKLKITPHISL